MTRDDVGDTADRGDPRDPWAEIAASGTDPDRLAAVVRRAAADRRGMATHWRGLVADGGDPVAALDAVASVPVLDDRPGETAARAWLRAGARVALPGDPGMPSRLVDHSVAPPWLAVTGIPPDTEQPAVAIVGSRKATGYGTGVAAWLAESVAQAGVRVVSGGAVGIDAAAHSAAVDRAGATTVVLGCGHAIDYPRPHAGSQGLFRQVVRAGGAVLSEGLPQDPPRAHRVRARNRLVAALADAVVVVEGRSRSGSLITAGWAADLGIPVLAVPGDVRAPGSAASHQLLRDGAAVCTEPTDLLAAVLGRLPEPAGHPAPEPGRRATGLPAWLHDPLAQAWPRPMPLARLVELGGRGTGPVLAAVTRAQVAGVLTRDVDGIRLCRRPAPS